ncbi:hypothetical protein A2W67_01260 [Candidatus Nomurabacteria bacterium RIFCSPLOWO2_02_40_28]|uniref:Uncharacterized protein n=2 Tax=Candidatus Nomuraibacteriota TaxID=1752729 RepID=A0A837I1U8_9BACT|nr:MAG: hypothetical protein UT27_C0001G0076 [Candidatus Nomurabacteria bacterium GW2011_GWD2_39_12]KKR20657.1 MAG: hypothetical protein UT51_C0002G0092 [Candidatus Nomurabacteria bacterium GW2011_GWC2_39_41]KKR37414.1 MAG: hypothetical protein UT70_C0001G0090 [Candidatus Nomurabacteria bacterium GW2011_GWE2_40_10]KKR38662.1 MAG: hypothetical protein UT73_C0002G0147 [Candidatus Nomurabacteria bacterium GW2011_GWB1_40_11]KKR40387.1 MAG: hypothetical protein UT74_C0001G0121 [Parcubacteria group b
MKTYFPKIPLFFSIIFLLFSCLAFFYFYGAIDNSNRETKLAESEWQSQVKKRDELKKLESSFSEVEKERTQLETHFAESSNIVPFLDTVEGLAPMVAAKAEVMSVEIMGDSPFLMVGMNVSGSFEAIYRFLMLLENSPYELDFASMNLERQAPSNASETKWTAFFNIRLLSFIQ